MHPQDDDPYTATGRRPARGPAGNGPDNYSLNGLVNDPMDDDARRAHGAHTPDGDPARWQSDPYPPAEGYPAPQHDQSHGYGYGTQTPGHGAQGVQGVQGYGPQGYGAPAADPYGHGSHAPRGYASPGYGTPAEDPYRTGAAGSQGGWPGYGDTYPTHQTHQTHQTYQGYASAEGPHGGPVGEPATQVWDTATLQGDVLHRSTGDVEETAYLPVMSDAVQNPPSDAEETAYLPVVGDTPAAADPVRPARWQPAQPARAPQPQQPQQAPQPQQAAQVAQTGQAGQGSAGLPQGPAAAASPEGHVVTDAATSRFRQPLPASAPGGAQTPPGGTGTRPAGPAAEAQSPGGSDAPVYLARLAPNQRARALGQSPIIAPGLQPAALTAGLCLLLAVTAELPRAVPAVVVALLQAVTAAGWFRLNGMWPARQGIALAFLAGLVTDVALLAVDREHAPVAALAVLGVWCLFVLVLQMRHHGSADERMSSLTAGLTSAALAVLAAGHLSAAPDATLVGAVAVAVATLARALPLPSAASVAVSLLAAAGAGIAAGQFTDYGAAGAAVGLAAGVCALVGLRVASYDYPSRFVHLTAGVALPLTLAAPAVYILGRILG